LCTEVLVPEPGRTIWGKNLLTIQGHGQKQGPAENLGLVRKRQEKKKIIGCKLKHLMEPFRVKKITKQKNQNPRKTRPS